MSSDPSTTEHRLNRLRFRAWRRGFSELDLIMGGFVDKHGPALDQSELAELEALMDEADQDVYAWIVGQTSPPAGHNTPLMQRLRAFRPTAA